MVVVVVVVVVIWLCLLNLGMFCNENELSHLDNHQSDLLSFFHCRPNSIHNLVDVSLKRTQKRYITTRLFFMKIDISRCFGLFWYMAKFSYKIVRISIVVHTSRRKLVHDVFDVDCILQINADRMLFPTWETQILQCKKNHKNFYENGYDV
jgi:hypothetical protein